MACPSRLPSHPLTENQRSHLLAMLDAGATDRSSACRTLIRVANHRYVRLNPIVVGALIDKGLAFKRALQVRGARWTAYWLTEAGVERARALQAEQEGSR